MLKDSRRSYALTGAHGLCKHQRVSFYGRELPYLLTFWISRRGDHFDEVCPLPV